MSAEPALTLEPVDIGGWAQGNTGIPYAFSFDSGETGPHVLITALIHGNELCGAHALDFLLRQEIRPRRGRLSLCFANFAAYRRFDPARPAASRFLDEDMNRVWSPDVLQSGRRSRELDRAREMLPLLSGADFLLDLHSMQAPSPALTLSGTQARGIDLALRVGFPAYVVADAGHAAGVRMRDWGPFADPQCRPTALLVECGQHRHPRSRAVAIEAALRFLVAVGTIEAAAAAAQRPTAAPPPPRVIEITEAVVAATDSFSLIREFQGLEVIPRAGTIIGDDGGRPLLTPYDDCVLIMPTRRLLRGQTAVRLGRFAPDLAAAS